MIRRFARVITGNPALGFGVALAVSLVLTAGLPRLGFDMHPNATFASGNQASKNLDELHRVFGPDDNDMIVLVEGDGLLEPDSLEALRKFRDQIRTIEDIKFVASIFDLNKPHHSMPLVPAFVSEQFDASRLRQDLRRHPVSADQLISSDGRLLTMLVRIKGDSLSISDISRVIEPLNRYSQEFQDATKATVQLAGHPAVRVDVLQTLQYAMVTGCIAAVAIGFVIAMLVFRHLPSVLIAVTPPAVGTLWIMGLLAWNGVAVSGLMTALPNLVFIIGLTDAVHLLLEAQRELHQGQSQRQSVFDAILRVGPACFLTSLTTFLGFGSLALSRTDSVREFGLWSAIGTSCAMLAVMIVLPTILMIIPRSWACNNRTTHMILGDWLKRCVEPTLRRPGLTSLLGVILCLIFLYPALRQTPDIIWTETMPHHSASVLAMDRADAELGGALLAYMMVRWPDGTTFPDRRTLEAAADVHNLFRNATGFSGPFSIRNLMATTPGDSLPERYDAVRKRADIASGLMVNDANRTLVVSARVPNDGSRALGQRLQKLEPELEEIRLKYPDYEFTLTGTSVAAAENMTSIIVDLARSLAIAAGMIFVVLAVAFRSLKIGVLTIVPNVLPLLVTAAGLTLLDMPLQITSALTFSLCLGLAVDDTIHVVVRYLWNLEHHPDRREAIIETVGHVGPALIVTTTILLGGFAAMMTSPMPGIRLFAMLSGVTLIAALIGDVLLFPAMLLWDWNAKSPAECQRSAKTTAATAERPLR